ncbi:unnamed protein product [Notodromas monacha]|uniref:Uncharacterized protein n=1 Tax=Notodromas monacha TaxID=399045 RepID=A0A7R9BSP4_9CRUS|nr:unnamed protein product [Notodromas monacha]CAG0919641.1 unnamed protein product [Notodromas monacha]
MMMPNHLMNSYAAPAAQTFMSHMSKAMGHPGQASPSYAYHDRNLARDGRRQEEPSEHLQDQRRHRPSPRQQQMPDRIRSPNRKPRGSHGKKSDKIVSQGSRKLGRDDHYEARSDKSYRNDGSRISPELPSQYRRCSSARPSEDQRRNTRERSQ